MQKEYDSIKELEELISTKYQRLVEETIDIEKKESIRKKAIEMTKKHFDIYTISPDELLEILKIIDGNMAPTREEIFSKQNTYNNQIITNSNNNRYQKAKEFLLSKKHLIELFASARSESFAIRENRAELERFSNILSKISGGKVINPEISIDELLPIIEQYFPQADQMVLLTDITKSTTELQMDLINSQQKEPVEAKKEPVEVKKEPTNEQIESLETKSPEEVKYVDQKIKETLIKLLEDEPQTNLERIGIGPNFEIIDPDKYYAYRNMIDDIWQSAYGKGYKNGKSKPVPTRQRTEEDMKDMEEKQDDSPVTKFDQEKYEQIRKKVFDEMPTNNTGYRIADAYVEPYLNGEMSLEEIKEVLQYYEDHFKQFISELLKKDIEKIDKYRSENQDNKKDNEENNEKDKKSANSKIDETYTKMIELFNEGFSDEDKEIEEKEAEEENSNKLAVVFTGSGNKFKKALKGLATDKKSREEIEDTIEKLRDGYTRGKPLQAKETGGLLIKGRTFKVLYKEFAGHLILHDIVKKADLNGYSNVTNNEVKEVESKIKSNGKESMELESDGEIIIDEIISDLGKGKTNE